jgi:short-subunit dehydrogenase
MKARMQFEGRWVLVTGASSGLGLEMARLLARDHRASLVLVARRADRLIALKRELETSYGVSAQVVVADLSSEDDVARVFREATAGKQLYAAILNAGVTYFGESVDLAWDECKRMLHTNIHAVTQLTQLCIPYLLERGEGGGLMLVASMAGLTPVPYQSVYSGTKAFVIALGQGLWHELKGKNVSITTFVPGGIATEMTDTAGLSGYFGHGGPMIQRSEACARDALSAFERRKDIYVPGLFNQVGALAGKVLPRRLLVGLVASEYRKALVLKKGG